MIKIIRSGSTQWICCIDLQLRFSRAGGESENPGEASSDVVGIICPPALVRIGLTDLPKSKKEGEISPPALI